MIRLRGARTEIGEHKVKIKLTDQEEREIITGDGTVNLSEPPAGVLEVEAGAVLVFDVPFERPGRYEFEIEVDSDISSVVPITVSLGPGTPPPDFTSPN